MTTHKSIAESYWRAECARDIDGVLNHYATNAHFVAPGWDLHGHDEIRRYYEDSASKFPGLEVDVVSDFSSGDFGAVEWDACLIGPTGVRYPITGVNLITLRDGLFAEVRAYFDTSKIPHDLDQ